MLAGPSSHACWTGSVCRGVGRPPGGPQAVDVGVVEPEDRVEPRRAGPRHDAFGVRRLGPRAADVRVHGVVGLRLDATVGATSVREPGVNATEARASAAGHPGEVRIAQRREVQVVGLDEHVPVPIRPVAMLHEEGVVPRAVGPVRGRKRRRKRRLARAEVVPVRERPVARAAGGQHDGADVRLEGQDVAPVPRQEVPAAVLALPPELVIRAWLGGWSRRAEVAELLPPRRVEAVHGRVEAPARRFGQRAGLHGRNPPGVPQDLVGPGPPSSQTLRRTKSTAFTPVGAMPAHARRRAVHRRGVDLL